MIGLRAICPFCHQSTPVHLTGPWPLHRHDVHGDLVCRGKRRSGHGYVCPGSRAVLPLYANPWAMLAYTQENPLRLTIYREVDPAQLTPGDVIDHPEFGPITIEVVEHSLTGLQLIGRRPGWKRRTHIDLDGARVAHLLPTADQEIEAWQQLGEAIVRATSDWDKEQDRNRGSDQTDLQAAPWQLVQHTANGPAVTLQLVTGTFNLALMPSDPAHPPPAQLADEQDFEPIAADG
jgi:hypothetical protein